MLKLNKVSIDYGNGRGLHEVSFQLSAGKVCGVLGRNGCGKTTCFRVLLGLLNPDFGSVSIDGEELAVHTLFGYVPEERSMLRNLTLKQQVFHLAKLKRMEVEEIQERFVYWMQYLQITQYENTKIIELSKGNQQKAQFLCALIHDPKILIFDEPLNGLDVDNVSLFQNLLWKLKEEKKYILISSHQYHNIEQYCDSVVYLKEGKVAFKGDIERIKRKYQTRIVRCKNKKIIPTKEFDIVKQIQEKAYIRYVVRNKEEALRLITYLLEKEVDEVSLQLLSLQDIIKEKKV